MSDSLLAKAKELFEESKYNNAQSVLSEIIEVDNTCAEAYFYLGNIFHIKGEIGRAIKAYSRVLEIEPAHTDASISLSVLYNDIGKYEEAKKVFDIANNRVKGESNLEVDRVEDSHINKKFSMKHYEIAELYLSYGRYDEALFEYDKVIALDRENLEARIRIAKVYSKKGFFNKAVDVLKTLRNEKPDYTPARIALGILHYGSGNVLEAQDEWQKALSKDPNNSEARMYLEMASSATETTL